MPEREICEAGRGGITVIDDAARAFLEARRCDGSARGVLTLRRKDGTTFLAHVASTVFNSANGELWTSMTFRDVTASERGRRALAILADAGRLLSSSLDPRTTIEHLTDLVSKVDDDHVVFTVSDTGAGIPPEDVPHLFDRYWQGSHSRDLGAGLGLSISRGIAEAHGGEIAVTSRPGQGATFTIRIPREAPGEPPPESSRS
jgi:hypothetical protein